MSIRKISLLRCRRRFCLRPAGFTLVEVMVVVIVLGIVAALLVPNLGGTSGTIRLTAAARRVASLFDYCYQSALATGKVHGVVFDQDGRKFQVVCEEPADSDDPEAPPTLSPVPLPGALKAELPEGVSIVSVSAFDASLISGDMGDESSGDESDGFRILFFPDGTTEFASILLKGPDGFGSQVQLNGLSGDISIESVSRLEMEESAQESGSSDDSDEGESE